jgi:hypothetical protein
MKLTALKAICSIESSFLFYSQFIYYQASEKKTKYGGLQ